VLNSGMGRCGPPGVIVGGTNLGLTVVSITPPACCTPVLYNRSYPTNSWDRGASR
jgi:hypothetical protein